MSKLLVEHLVLLQPCHARETIKNSYQVWLDHKIFLPQNSQKNVFKLKQQKFNEICMNSSLRFDDDKNQQLTFSSAICLNPESFFSSVISMTTH